MNSIDNSQNKTLKLNYKRTMLIGFAFFGILLLWQVYDSWCSPLLTDLFTRKIFNNEADPLEVQWLVGIVMSVDNLAALIILPIFGSLSDRTSTKIGKRMPYILIGTFVAAIAFPFIPFVYHLNSVVGMIIIMGIVLIFMMMYRNPAVSLMPDITPKPLRTKANGIINIMGYIGGASATVLTILLPVSDYLKQEVSVRSLMQIEIPFLVASVLMVISALVLFFTINENKVLKEVHDDIEEGERLAAIESPIDDDKPMSKANKVMLFAILGAEFLWFMSDNAIATFINNYVIYFLNANSKYNGTMTIIGGVGSVIGFAIAGRIADKIGRKWTISCGLALTFIGLFTMIFVTRTVDTEVANVNGTVVAYNKYPTILFVVGFLRGFGMSLVHSCSFPMIVELCSAKRIGKFTGYYYASSMSAQTITPILLGIIFTKGSQTLDVHAWRLLPIYSTILIVASFIVFTVLVKNIKAHKVKHSAGIEAFGADD